MDSLTHTLDQIDVIKRMCAKYPETFEFVTSADGNFVWINMINARIIFLAWQQVDQNIDNLWYSPAK